MTQEEKQLLLIDLCARLPHGVKCRFETTVDTYQTIEFSREGANGLLVDFDELYCYWFNEGYILPYLRPMSSMTEEERKEFHHYASVERNYLGDDKFYTHYQMIDWLNSHHFDYRGLIEKGLALEAPEGMYMSYNETEDITKKR